MQVILNEDVKSLGVMGDVVKVKDGYANNFLFPKGLARPATPANLKEVERLKSKRVVLEAKKLEEAKAIAAKLTGAEINIEVKVGEEGKLYGSVTNGDIAEKLAEKGYVVDKKHLELEHPIKTLGLHEVPVKLFKDVAVSIKVWVLKKEE